MGEEEEGSPEDGRADREVVLEMAGSGTKVGFGLSIFVEAGTAKALVGLLIVPGEIQAVLNERGAGKCVITDAIAAHPGIEKWKRKKKK